MNSFLMHYFFFVYIFFRKQKCILEFTLLLFSVSEVTSSVRVLNLRGCHDSRWKEFPAKHRILGNTFHFNVKLFMRNEWINAYQNFP